MSPGAPPVHRRPREPRARVVGIARSILGVRLLSQLVAVRTRGRRVPYDAQSAWNVRYERVAADGGIHEAATIKRYADARLARYHYNTVENAILEHALRMRFPDQPAVLDIGSGAGHWIEFYRSVFDARRVAAVEIAAPAAAALRSAYAGQEDVTIEEADVADDLDLGERFDIVNAVDVLFHVVDEGRWRRAVENLGRHLSPGGRLVVAEHVARIPYDAGLRAPDTERGEPSAEGVLMVTKRVRSLRQWTACGRAAGLVLVHTSRLRQSRSLSTPANRLLVFAPVGAARGDAAR